MRILDVEISNTTLTEMTNLILNKARDRERLRVYTPNSEIIYYAHKNPEFKEILNRSDVSIPDGIGVLYASNIIKQPLRERVAGYDLICNVFSKAEELDIYIYGGREEALMSAIAKIGAQYSGVKVLGFTHGYSNDSERIVEDICSLNPQLVMVCLGSPKQEMWIDSYAEKLPSCVIVGAGGTIDVLGGSVERAPQKWRDLNLEWLYRCVQRPERMWRILNLFKFGFSVLWARVWK